MDIYNVNSYTEKELIEDVLELNRPTDGELEARLLPHHHQVGFS